MDRYYTLALNLESLPLTSSGLALEQIYTLISSSSPTSLQITLPSAAASTPILLLAYVVSKCSSLRSIAEAYPTGTWLKDFITFCSDCCSGNFTSIKPLEDEEMHTTPQITPEHKICITYIHNFIQTLPENTIISIEIELNNLLIPLLTPKTQDYNKLQNILTLTKCSAITLTSILNTLFTLSKTQFIISSTSIFPSIKLLHSRALSTLSSTCLRTLLKFYEDYNREGFEHKEEGMFVTLYLEGLLVLKTRCEEEGKELPEGETRGAHVARDGYRSNVILTRPRSA